MTHGGNDPRGIFIHTGSNLADWDMGMQINEWSDGYLYPTLIGDTGHDTLTSQFNKLYYFKLNDGNVGDLYRRYVRIDYVE